MIKKTAQSLEELDYMYKNIVFNNSEDIRPSLQDRIRISESAIKEAQEAIAAGNNPFYYNADFIEKLFGSPDYNTLSQEERKTLITAAGTIMLTSDLDADILLEGITSAFNRYKTEFYSKNKTEEVVEQEVVTEELPAEDNLYGWYVTSGQSFSPSERFFGPFQSKTEAILHSILIHPSGAAGENTVLSAAQALNSLRGFDKNILDLDGSSDIKNEPVLNANISGAILQVISELSSGSIDADISKNEDLFYSLVDYIEDKNSESSIDSILKINNILSLNFIKDFATYYLNKLGLLKSKKEEDVPVEVQPDKVNEEKKDISEAILELNSKNNQKKLDLPKSDVPLSKAVYNAFDLSGLQSISIVDEQDADMLSDSKISEFITQMSIKSAELSKITDEAIDGTLDKCFDQLKEFFEKSLKKDREIKQLIYEFRRKNPLLLSQEWTQTKSAEWEFQSRFSITKRLFENKETFENISSFFYRLMKSFLFGREQKIKKDIDIKVSKYVARSNIKIDSDGTEDAAYYVYGNILVILEKVAKNAIKEKIDRIISTSLLDMIDASSVIDELALNDISLQSYINNEIQKYFQSEENILDQQSFNTIACGVCGQVTQVPSEYKDELTEFSRSENQYSFFKENGDFISESELASQSHSLSADAKNMISAIINKQYSKKSATELSSILNSILNKSYPWEEINRMIYDPEAIDGSQESKILLNVIGHIIRNDKLKSLGASSSGVRGIFQNKTLCAASLIKLAASMKQDTRILKSLEEKRDYACLARVRKSYINEGESIPEYQLAAYSEYSGSGVSSEQSESGFKIGYRFSRNTANCPCHISQDSAVGSSILSSKKYEGLINFIAIPKVPENMVDELVGNERLGLKREDIYYPPTAPDGSLSSGDQLSRVAYPICGKKVSISMFDKDPSSKNYIRNVLLNILNSKGKESFVSAVKTLINYGIEMNDLRPHVEAVVGNIVSVSSRKNILDVLFKKSKISTAQEIKETDAYIIKDLGLVCDSGHRFTLEQSWMFSRAHSSVAITHTTRTVSKKAILSLLSGEDDSILKTLTSSKYSDGIGIIKVFSENEPIPSGYIMPNQASSIEELIGAINDQRLYFKVGSLVYIIGQKSSSGLFKKNPWEYGKLSMPSRTDFYVTRYIGGLQSTTVSSEEGGTTELDIADISEMPDESAYESMVASKAATTKIIGSTYTKEIIEKYGLLEALMPGITKEYFRSYSEIPEDAESFSASIFSEAVSEFINKFVKLLKISRYWGKISADGQADFLMNPLSVPKKDPKIIDKIKLELQSISNTLNISNDKLEVVYSNFFNAYDINGLFERNVSFDKFVSLAGIAQYYRDFSVPFISNLNEKLAVSAIIENISSAVYKNIGLIFGVDESSITSIVGENKVREFCNNISALLYSPYKNYEVKRILEDAIVNYTGRAITFSYAIDVVNNIRSFYSRYFLNQSSQLYIGVTGARSDVFGLINESLQSAKFDESADSAFIPKIIIMDNEEFNANISEIESGLKDAYSLDTVFLGYMRSKGISPDISNKSLYSVQRAIVFSRFEQCIKMATASIDYLILDLISKPIGSRSIGNAARQLDLCIEPLMRQRDPQNFEIIKPKILESRMLYGEADRIFERNAVQYGKIQLNPDLVRFDTTEDIYPAPMVFSVQQFYSMQINKNKLINGNNYVYKFAQTTIKEPYLILIKEIIVDRADSAKRLYICIAPKDIIIKDPSKVGDLPNIDIMDIMPSGTIRLNTKQGLEFASRYIKNIDSFDKSRLLLVDSSIRTGILFTQSHVDSAISGSSDQNNIFEIRIQKIDEPPVFWPPPNNLIMNNYYVARSPGDVSKKYIEDLNEILLSKGISPQIQNKEDAIIDKKMAEHLKTGFRGDKTKDIELYYRSLLGENIRDFITNIDVFPTSQTSKTMITSSSHGLILPVGGEYENISRAVNSIDKELIQDTKDSFTLTESNIFIPRDGMTPLNISWTFIARDPQFKDENGVVKTKIVQSGCVQKLKYISIQLSELYNWFKQTESILLEIKKKKFRRSWNISVQTEDMFLQNMISEVSPLVNISIDLSSGLRTAYPAKYESVLPAYPKESNITLQAFMEKLGLLCDLYNAAQKVNKIYMEQTPMIDSVSAINLADKKSAGKQTKKTSQQAFCLRLLDPYSIWSMLNNPAMHTTFGGPINPDDIDSYKEFVKSTFGLQDIVSAVHSETKIAENLFTVEDLFDLPGFFLRSKNVNEDILKKVAEFFNLQLDENNNVETHMLGTPKASAVKNKKISGVIESCQTSDYAVHPDSHVIYPAKLTHSLNDLTNSALNAILKEARNKVKQMRGDVEERITSESVGLTSEEINQKILNELKRLTIEEVMNHKDVLESRRKAAALNSGEEVLSIDSIVKASTSVPNIQRPNELIEETLKIFRDLWTSDTKKIGKDLSWRKIAQSATDDDGTIITSLYRRWWEAYLNTIAKNYYN